MGTAAQNPTIVGPLINTAQGLYSGVARFAFGSVGDNVNWPGTNRIVYVPITLPRLVHVQRFFWTNGNAAAGNLIGGVYNAAFSKLAETASTAQTGTAQVQFVTFDNWFDAGLYYLALIGSTTTNLRVVRSNLTQAHEPGTSCVFYEDAGAFALPATATPTNYRTSNFTPICGLDIRGSGL